MCNRAGGWICTYTGIAFYPLDPRPEEVCIEDIAHALSLQCRFSGHCRRFYSVAEHSVRVADELWRLRGGVTGVSIAIALAGLLHDAAEAYLVDVPRPLKRLQTFAEYRAAETRLQELIYLKYLPADVVGVRLSPEIQRVDNVLLATEKRDLMTTASQHEWLPLPEPLGRSLADPWSARKAELRFAGNFNFYRALLQRTDL